MAADAAERAQTFADVLRAEEKDVGPQLFAPANIERRDVREVVSARALSAMHFASVAPWWRTAPEDVHAYAPSNEQQIQAWLKRTLAYVSQELARV